MPRNAFRALLLLTFAGLLLALLPAGSPARAVDGPALLLAPTPVFRYPVVQNTTISGYFDHNNYDDLVTFYNGRKNSSKDYGFYFSCGSPSMWDFVGCEDSVSGEAGCRNDRELWYDQHHGTDYEFSPDWHTGATCRPDDFKGITRAIYAPAKGRVLIAGTDYYNGNYIKLVHDLNGNGDYYDDGFASAYLHFENLAVRTGELVEEGQYLGLGGSSGYSSSPHLHFEVQRSNNNWQSRWSIDPYGWQGSGSDPWLYKNELLWRYNITYSYRVMLPHVGFEQPAGCPFCGEMLRNNGFEQRGDYWSVDGVDVIASRSTTALPINPYSGSWLAWLGGRPAANDRIYQTFQAPVGASSGKLRYYLRVDTEETENVAYDRMTASLRGPDGVIQTLDEVDNRFTPRGRWVLREANVSGLANWQGKNLRIQFDASTDGSLTTSFYLDEIYFETVGP